MIPSRGVGIWMSWKSLSLSLSLSPRRCCDLMSDQHDDYDGTNKRRPPGPSWAWYSVPSATLKWISPPVLAPLKIPAINIRSISIVSTKTWRLVDTGNLGWKGGEGAIQVSKRHLVHIRSCLFPIRHILSFMFSPTMRVYTVLVTTL